MYFTIPRQPKTVSVTFDDILFGLDQSKFIITKDTKDTVTWCKDTIPFSVYSKLIYPEVVTEMFRKFNAKYADLINTEDKATLYRSFKIPKRSGGLRQIDAPKDELMVALNELKKILEQNLYFTYHTSAFAYVRGRSTIDAVKRHQYNKSRWVLKTDLSKFFPSTTPEWLTKMLYQTFPLCYYARTEAFKTEFEKALTLCFLNGGLPQGTPTSPMLTNQMMIPIDYTINKYCRTSHPHICYTRYADDMDFSCEFSFNWSKVCEDIAGILTKFEAPFSFNTKKTHYGSTAGRNWMLGVMLNKDNQITVGHENKKVFKASLFNFAQAYKDKQPWSIEDTQHLQGLASYYLMVEKDAVKEIIDKYSKKFGFSIPNAMKEIIKGNA